MNVIGYARVSTTEQAESGLGLAAQEKAIRQYCELYGLALDRIEIDAGWSGKTMDRPAVQRVLADLRAGKAGGVVVAKLDRLSRSVRDLGELLDGVFAPGRAALHSVAERLDTSSAAGRMLVGILAAVAQWERESIGERTKAALAAKKTRGKRVGSIPYGYRLAEDGESLAEDPAEQAAIERARELRADGLSLRRIAAALTAEGYRPRGRRWYPQTVARILETEAAA
jgi:DNA invertase Pin-like site-specific DNA recombinase